jgi:lysine 2,3-aminomutase
MAKAVRTTEPSARAADQPYEYPLKREFVEPDWRRFPGWKDVTEQDWESALWQRRNSIKNIKDLRKVLGDKVDEALIADIEKDQKQFATMSILVPPQLMNCMDLDNLQDDPTRCYLLPAASDRHPEWANHPEASRDSLHEAEMWAVEGLTHRYPTKVLAEMLSTCPQYCGHCTRMDLVGNNTDQVQKFGFKMQPQERYEKILDYLRKTKSVRDVVISGGDIANLPIQILEPFVAKVLDIEHIRDVRLASKGFIGIPQHFLQDDVLKGLERLARQAFKNGVNLAMHTHANHANQVTPLVRKAATKLYEAGFHAIRNQGVLLRGVNADAHDLLDLCFSLTDNARITPYYFYMCDMIPNSEHWRVSVHEAQRLQHDLMGYLPGFSTPRIVCDVPYVGKRWVFQCRDYDEDNGISYWTKNYRTGIEADDPQALTRRYEYYDPIHTLPAQGQAYWRERAAKNQAKA